LGPAGSCPPHAMALISPPEVERALWQTPLRWNS